MQLTKLQQEAFNRAKELIENESWFKGVCLDNMPSDAYISKEGVERVAQDLALETAMWDCPTFPLTKVDAQL